MSPSHVDNICIKGACEHNLKNISLKIPHNKITVVTGLSGSGKSSLAFDTIYAEGQRRYIESLSTYARHFVEALKKPSVDAIYGLCPSIAIDQKAMSHSPRSTVGTVTEVYDYLRLLFARLGVPHCPEHRHPMECQSVENIVSEVFDFPAQSQICILAPMVQDKKGSFKAELAAWEAKGFVRARVDGRLQRLSSIQLEKNKRHNIDLLVDKLFVQSDMRTRAKESTLLALKLSNGLLRVECGKQIRTFSMHNACPKCGFSVEELEPGLFSFNHPRGACKECGGLGAIDYELEDGQLWSETCASCQGLRLNPTALSVLIKGYNISQLSCMPTGQLYQTLSKFKWTDKEQLVAEKILQQIQGRLEYMSKVGTSYLSCNRAIRSLSGGETQRLRLATQVGSALVGVLYVLDEPSIGLHPRDHHRLLGVLKELCHRGNTLLLVEHDEDTIRAADHLVDLGPGAGSLGGHISAQGTVQQIVKSKKSLTGQYLSGRKCIEVPAKRRRAQDKFLTLSDASGHNLKNVDLNLPLGLLVGVTGVSGSGKSSLITHTLYRKVAQKLNKAQQQALPLKSLKGLRHIDRVCEVDQGPIGRSPRSTPATYVGILTFIRGIFAELPEAKIRGYKPTQFSFNLAGGRCEACQGHGVRKVEMHFLTDVYAVCDTCGGTRYSSEIRQIKFKQKSIADVLQMTVREAIDFFANQSYIRKKLETLDKVGLSYLTLGQSATTLSGGEAQRIKLSRELSKTSRGHTLYILDEPTTGLHFEDVRKLIELLQALVSRGHSVVVIEHHLDVIKSCDHIIDLGPDGGEQGGRIVAQGTPEQVARSKRSITGPYLKKVL